MAPGLPGLPALHLLQSQDRGGQAGSETLVPGSQAADSYPPRPGGKRRRGEDCTTFSSPQWLPPVGALLLLGVDASTADVWGPLGGLAEQLAAS